MKRQKLKYIIVLVVLFTISTIDISSAQYEPVATPVASGGGGGNGQPTETFRVGPTIRLRPVNDIITQYQDGAVELYMDNPSLNDVLLTVDLRINVPSGVHISGEGLGEAGVPGMVYGKFEVPSGSARTIYISIKADNNGDFSAQFSGIYYPGNNKDAYQPISLTHPFKVTIINPTPTAVDTIEKFRVGPTVRIRPLNDEITKDQDGLVELYMDNPSLNDVILSIDLRVNVPSGIYVYGQGFGEAAAAGTVYGKFEVPPGSARTINIVIKAEKLGDFSAQFSGLYWPGDNKDAYQPISLTYPFKVTIINPTPTPIPTYNPNNSIHKTHVGIGTINMNCDTCHGFPPKIYETPRDCISCHPEPIPTFTPTVTTVAIAIPTTVAIAIPTTVATAIPTTVATVVTTASTPIGKKAILAVINKVDRSGDRAVITIKIKNIGEDKAKFVKFSSEIPSGIDWKLESGADRNGNTVTWNGDIDIGREHNIVYSMNRPNIDLNIPLEVTYVKDSATANRIMNKAIAKGIRSENILDNIDPQDLEKILLIIQISKTLLSGFQTILGIVGILSIYHLRKRIWI